MNEQLEQACALLREKAEEVIKDKPVREAVYLLIDAHENAKRVVSMLRGQLERTYDMLDRITNNPKFKELMEELNGKDDGKEERGDGEA